MKPAPHSEPLDAQIARFVRDATDEMSPAQAAPILGMSEDTVFRLCNQERMPAKVLDPARRESDTERQRRKTSRTYTGPRRRWTLTKAGLITYMVKQTSGDERELILHAIEQMCPQWLPVARRAALGEAPAAELPPNVIPIKGRRSTRSASASDDEQRPRQLDLFEKHTA
jgi:hypothetical protein